MSDIKQLTERIKKFVDDRDWRQNQQPKDLAISVIIEAAELLEHFQWKSGEELENYIKNNKEEISDEIADVAIYLLGLADNLDVDLTAAIENKMEKNAKKYPLSK